MAGMVEDQHMSSLLLSRTGPGISFGSAVQSSAVLGLYFSANWCSGCRAFTPQLEKIYAALKKEGKNFEVIFASSDHDSESFQEYYAEMPWLAVPYENESLRAALEKYKKKGLPQLVLFDGRSKTVLTVDGRSALMESGASGYPWGSSSVAAPFVASGYAGFGSFTTEESVEAMMARPVGGYTPPSRAAVPTSDLWDAASPAPGFGAPMRRFFYLDPSWTYVNHGAFGGASRVALRTAQRWAEHAETQPLRFIDRELFPLMCFSARCLAGELGVPPTSIALVANATYALSSVIASIPLAPGAIVFCLDIGYGSVLQMLQVAAAKAGAIVVVGRVDFPLPGGHRQLLEQVLPQIPPSCALAVFDYVTSNSGMVLPVMELVAGARAAGAALVLVDGAHALGAFDLSQLPALGADYFVGNCHKWMCSSRGLGMLYVRPGVSPVPRPAVISHGYGSGFSSEFIWDGARDYSAVVALPSLLEWWQWVGLEGAREYCRALLLRALGLLSAAWGTDTHVPAAEFYSHMACIQLPAQCLPPGATEGSEFKCTSSHSKMMQDALHHGFQIEVPAKTLPGPLGGHDKRCYLRISAMVYNTLEDFQTVADAVKTISWEMQDGSTPILLINGVRASQSKRLEDVAARAVRFFSSTHYKAFLCVGTSTFSLFFPINIFPPFRRVRLLAASFTTLLLVSV